MANYDAIIIGAGHNGLTSAAYLAKAGKKVLVLERRHVLGGAAVTEEIYPGFKYSVCSYVVSLLRPEVIRDLELPKYDLEIIPLDSTFTPLPNGDYLFRCGDHARTRREIARHSPTDAEAYEQYGQLMVQMAMAVKPLLGMIPPEPTTWNPKDLFGLARGRQPLPRSWREASLRAYETHDHELGGFSRRMVRDRGAQSDHVGKRHHRHIHGPALAGDRLRAACIITWASSTARFVPGVSPAAAWARSAA